jgi:hypothetical protein
MVENRFQLWCDSPRLCDQAELKTFGAIAGGGVSRGADRGRRSRRASAGPAHRLAPRAARQRLVIQSPWDVKDPAPNKIKHGVEVDPSGRHVAFYVKQDDNTFKRLPAYGEKSGRKLAWLVYAMRQAHGRRARQAALVADPAVVAGSRPVPGQHAAQSRSAEHDRGFHFP